MYLGPNFWPLGPHRAGPMRAGRIEFNKYEPVGHDEHFGTPFAHIITLNVPKAAPRAKFLALRATYGRPYMQGTTRSKKYEYVGHEEHFGTPFAHVNNLQVLKDAPRAKFLALRAK